MHPTRSLESCVCEGVGEMKRSLHFSQSLFTKVKQACLYVVSVCTCVYVYVRNMCTRVGHRGSCDKYDLVRLKSSIGCSIGCRATEKLVSVHTRHLPMKSLNDDHWTRLIDRPWVSPGVCVHTEHLFIGRSLCTRAAVVWNIDHEKTLLLNEYEKSRVLSTLTSPPAVFLQRIAPEMFDVVGFIDMYPLLERERKKVCMYVWMGGVGAGPCVHIT